jgi:predicted unusual protein kinase regulating ubiquinone biosynthesis (AarF/ABC1/UbiB family)
MTLKSPSHSKIGSSEPPSGDRTTDGRHSRFRRASFALRTARRRKLLRVLRELGVVGDRPATLEGAREFRRALEELGTTYVKLGQLLSSRPDLIPDEYIAELTRLVDEVPAEPFPTIEAIVEQEIGTSIFRTLDPSPLAAASIAQVHEAVLHDGREVVVKVRRPGIDEEIDQDLDLLRATASLLERRSATARLLQLNALVDELDWHLHAELDLREEAFNTELIAGLVERHQEIVVPEVIHPYVTERVLVLERIHGDKVTVELAHDLVDADKLATTFFRAYVHQVCIDGVYHADPHRGNVFLTEDGKLALLDFGLIGRLDDDTRTTLSMLLLALAQNRAEDVADLIYGLSLTEMDSDPAAFVHEVRRKLPRYHWRPLAGIRAGEALADLQRLSLQFGIRLPPAFALVGKTLSQADSIARTLHPELDPISLLRREALELMTREAVGRAEPTHLFSYAFTQAEAVARLPRRTADLIERIDTGRLKVGIVPSDLAETEHMLRSVANRIGIAMIIVGLLISSALMARVNHEVSLAGFCLSGLIALYMIWRIVHTPGEL